MSNWKYKGYSFRDLKAMVNTNSKSKDAYDYAFICFMSVIGNEIDGEQVITFSNDRNMYMIVNKPGKMDSESQRKVVREILDQFIEENKDII